jgi:phosphoglycolate phosphatase-like HAD superfamily hydrolase
MQSWKRHLYSVASRANSVGNAPLFKVQCEPSNHRRNCSFELTGGIGPIERSKMKSNSSLSGINRRALLSGLAMLPALSGLPFSAIAQTQTGVSLGSWNEGPAKQAIFDFVRATTNEGSSKFVPLQERIATFDQDGTLWVEHPIYSQVVYCLDRVPALAEKDPTLKDVEPFKTVLSGNREAIAKLSLHDLEKVLFATLSGMSVDDFEVEVKKWLASAKDGRWKRPFTELIYQPMLELMQYLRSNGFKTYIVTGGGQDFVRVYSERVYGVQPEQVVGSAEGTKYGYQKDGTPFLTKEPKLLLNDDNAGKPEGIHLMIGRRPRAAFGNSDGDREMLEYTGAGDGARLMMLVMHDDAQREYAYGPAQGLPETKVGAFSQSLYDEAKKKNWIVISMKNDWKRVFAFD